MNPIIYFDELDKISRTPKGDEITNLLVHLTDPAQNSHFRDKYFHGIDIDLSKATIIFSFNNISNVNPILLDRITTIETKYLMKPHKIHIAQNYLLPNIMKETGLNSDDIKISDKNIGKLIEKYTREGGVRKLKSLLYNVVREVNLSNLMKTPVCGTSIIFPMKLQHRHIKEFMKNKLPIQPEKVHSEPKVGFITGMYAGSLGVGGVLPIQILWVPASQPMTLKATGNLRKVIKESTQVATSLAWNSLSKEEQTKYLAMWKDKPVGFHIHCPDGAIPKDGPSAGTALSVALYSMLSNKLIRHDVAITGEITLEGKVTAIGGLEEKLVGAKKAGVKLALIPRENEKHLLKVNERNPTLIDDEFKVIMIDTLNDALKHSLL
jgi:ATP-dependent Lon protease